MADDEASIRTVAVVGGGPASSTLASFLAREGLDVGVFHVPSDRSILVGESLVPGVIPILRELGVEDRIKPHARRKPGATIRLPDGTRLDFVFEDIPGPHPDYAYNVLREPFNEKLRDVAGESGVRYFARRANLHVRDGSVHLQGDTSEKFQSAFGRDPDLIVDATGRARLFAEMMELPDSRGSRTDTALFTHLQDAGVNDGHIHTEVFEYGWNWRIPLPDRASVGVVADTEYLQSLGESAVERFEGFVEENKFLADRIGSADRIEPVFEYSNYQWTSEQLYGDNWVLLGDAGGFVDPVFSSGLYLGMEGAQRLAKQLLADGRGGLSAYEEWMQSTYANWRKVIGEFYNGRLLALFKMGKEISDGSIEEAISDDLRRDIGKIFTGLAGDSSECYSNLQLVIDSAIGDAEANRFSLGPFESSVSP